VFQDGFVGGGWERARVRARVTSRGVASVETTSEIEPCDLLLLLSRVQYHNRESKHAMDILTMTHTSWRFGVVFFQLFRALPSVLHFVSCAYVLRSPMIDFRPPKHSEHNQMHTRLYSLATVFDYIAEYIQTLHHPYVPRSRLPRLCVPKALQETP